MIIHDSVVAYKPEAFLTASPPYADPLRKATHMVQKGSQYSLDHPHPFPGKLIVVEGIDGSGKSTQLQLAYRWLSSMGYRVFLTEWNSADLVKAVTKRGKKKMVLTPTTFSLVHATDFAHRLVFITGQMGCNYA